MPGLASKIIMLFLRAQLSGWSEGTIIEQRTRQEKSARFFHIPKHVRSQLINIDGVPSELIESPDSNAGTILYLHGGAYALGSINTHRELVARLVIATKYNALAIDYRLAPENPFPAALEDTLLAYKWILSKGIDPSRVIIAGDSAGGGLAIATLIALRDKGIPLPAGAFCFSPWLDLTLSGDTIAKNGKHDPILSSSILKMYAQYYTGKNKASNPLISPLFADLRNLPPVYIQSGMNEILLDDSIRFCEKAQRSGVDATLETWEDMFHVFQLFSFLPEATDAINHVVDYLNRIR